jgi:hypothetical protein
LNAEDWRCRIIPNQSGGKPLMIDSGDGHLYKLNPTKPEKEAGIPGFMGIEAFFIDTPS